ncbi:DUF4334 domain-containing protein [Mesobaculum littorinae]|uniref:DUF4334 domain-containing protein n=1 Tax=Mesobaculum littorinae TaxID=2486419 RepID=A0A438ALK9_9RHOB|nr:GXWXG domain-containing protein [Mesobaculum littorinae]RVV99524.1 DUF4334 domain-containing protein [Mesobaculum littorinae]
MTDLAARTWALRAVRTGVPRAEALEVFDALPPVPPGTLRGAWHGEGIATSHPLDGALEACGWWGKRFESDDRVFPLLFGPEGALAIDPARLPLRLAIQLWPRLTPGARRATGRAFRTSARALATGQPGAHLAQRAYRGAISTAMVYDRQPIIDHFRSLSADRVLGMMELKDGLSHHPPLVFTLTAT